MCLRVFCEHLAFEELFPKCDVLRDIYVSQTALSPESKRNWSIEKPTLSVSQSFFKALMSSYVTKCMVSSVKPLFFRCRGVAYRGCHSLYNYQLAAPKQRYPRMKHRPPAYRISMAGLETAKATAVNLLSSVYDGDDTFLQRAHAFIQPPCDSLAQRH